MPFTDYFAAPSDQDAARVATVDDPKDLGFDVVYAKNIDPVVLLGQLELILTESTQPGARHGQLVADPNRAPIVAVSDELRDALAGLELPARSAAETWATAEEFHGLFPVDFLVLFLRQLSELARTAVDRNQHLYCRWSQ